jgi:hypothetical protein
MPTERAGRHGCECSAAKVVAQAVGPPAHVLHVIAEIEVASGQAARPPEITGSAVSLVSKARSKSGMRWPYGRSPPAGAASSGPCTLHWRTGASLSSRCTMQAHPANTNRVRPGPQGQTGWCRGWCAHTSELSGSLSSEHSPCGSGVHNEARHAQLTTSEAANCGRGQTVLGEFAFDVLRPSPAPTPAVRRTAQ